MALPEIQTEANTVKLVIMEPLGPQGPKLGLGFSSQEQFEKFDQVIGLLPKKSRKNFEKLSEIATELGVNIVKP